jgi:hypothetical protein
MVVLYIDPGVGSLAIQALIATVVAVPFLLREQLGRFVARLRGSKQDDQRNKPPA